MMLQASIIKYFVLLGLQDYFSKKLKKNSFLAKHEKTRITQYSRTAAYRLSSSVNSSSGGMDATAPAQ
jgi:hypothetical protein